MKLLLALIFFLISVFSVKPVYAEEGPLNIYLFWFFFYSGIIGNLFSSRTVTNPEEEKALLSNIEGWRNSQKSFSKMMSDQKNIAKKFESKNEE